MISNFLLLAMEATATAEAASEVAHEGGFGLNLDFWETNVINLVILLGLLFFFGRKVLGNILGERRSKIAEAIALADAQQKKTASALALQQQKLAEAKIEAEKILKTAQERAKVVQTEIAAQSVEDIERMQATAAKDLSNEQERVTAELKQRLVGLAIADVESRLKSGLDDSAQKELLDRNLAQLGGN
jgi:F-type H+-transporting ATPase subunit b